MSALERKFFSSKATTIGLTAVVALLIGVSMIGPGGDKKGARAEPAELKVAALEEKAAPVEAAPADAETAPFVPDVIEDPMFAAPQNGAADNPGADFGATTVQEASSDPVRLAAASDSRGANSFNRLMKKPSSAPNAPPARDGIHDAGNPGTELLQWPSVAFEGLPRTADGNKIDWVKALDSGKISPRYEASDPNAEPFLLDLVIVRQVKGSMPNVVYPHQQHTQWLDCSNCHDEIFIPQKGANQISMAGILLGQKCGVCHGKVAFPVSDCRRCHAQPKTEEELRALADRSSWTKGGGE